EMLLVRHRSRLPLISLPVWRRSPAGIAPLAGCLSWRCSPPRPSLLLRGCLRLLVCLTDGEGPACERRAIESVDCCLGLSGVWHLDKAKAAGLTAPVIPGNTDAFDEAIGRTKLAQRFFRGGPGQIADKDAHGTGPSLLERWCQGMRVGHRLRIFSMPVS